MESAGAADPDPYLTGSRLRFLHVDEFRSVLPVDQPQRAHMVLLVVLGVTLSTVRRRRRPRQGQWSSLADTRVAWITGRDVRL